MSSLKDTYTVNNFHYYCSVVFPLQVIGERGITIGITIGLFFIEKSGCDAFMPKVWGHDRILIL